MLVYPRQSFLPPHVTECVETTATWGEFRRPSSRLDTYCFGFDSSGKYYTEYSRPKDETDDRTVFVYSCNEETEKLQVSLIKLLPKKGSTIWNYDPFFTRWFFYEKLPASEDGSQPLILYSGSLKHLLRSPSGSVEAISFKEIVDFEVKLAPSADRIRCIDKANTKEHGYLSMVLVFTKDRDFIFDLILIDKVKPSHCQSR